MATPDPMREPSMPANFLPRSLVGRFGLGLLSSATTASAGAFLWALAIGPIGKTWAERCIRLGMGELFAAILAVGVSGVVWSLATPAWLPEIAWRFTRRLVILGLIPVVILAGLALLSL